MVGRGGGKKICSRSIAPGKLLSRIQASRTQLFSKQNVPDKFNNSSNSHITDEIAHAVRKSKFFFYFNSTNLYIFFVEFTLIFIVFTLVDLERNWTTYKAHINKATPTEFPATKLPTTTTLTLNDQASEGIITIMDESTLLKTWLSCF